MSTENSITDKQLNDADDAVMHISLALGISEKQFLDILEDGWKLNHIGTDSNRFNYFIDEMRATHDAY